MANINEIFFSGPIASGGPFGKHSSTTAQASLATAVSFSPCAYAVHSLALKVDSDKAAKAIQSFQYLANPIDSIIQSIVLPIFTVIDHVRDLSQGSKLDIAVKTLLTPVTLPLKFALTLLMGGTIYLANAALQLIIPAAMISSIVKGKQAAYAFFYEMNNTQADYSKLICLKPIQILPLKFNDETNPFVKRKQELLAKIDQEFQTIDARPRSFAYDASEPGKIIIQRALHNRYNQNPIDAFTNYVIENPQDRESSAYKSLEKNMQEALLKKKEYLSWQAKATAAERTWKEIDYLSTEAGLIVNPMRSTFEMDKVTIPTANSSRRLERQ